MLNNPDVDGRQFVLTIIGSQFYSSTLVLPVVAASMNTAYYCTKQTISKASKQKMFSQTSGTSHFVQNSYLFKINALSR